MGLLNLPRIPRGASQEQMANIYNMAIEEMEHRLNGFLQSNNIQEVGGWRVSQTELISKDGDVGMSTADDGVDPVRMFAGGVDKDTAPWRVTQGGKMHATGATIESSVGYPKIALDPDGNLLGAYLDGNNYFEIQPSYSPTGAPTLYWVSGGSTACELSTDTSAYTFKVIAREFDLTTDIQGNINLKPALGYSVTIPSLFEVIVRDTGQPLSTYLDAKATAGASTGSGGGASLNGGIPIGTTLAVAGGGSVTWGGISVPAHTHTQN